MTTLANYIKNIRSRGLRYFTSKEVMKDLKITSKQVRDRIYYLKKTGEVISPAKNFYIIVAPEELIQGAPDPGDLVIMLMRHKKIDYYACVLTAGLYHGAAHQRPMVFQVMVSERMKPLIFGAVKIDFIYKKSIKGLPIQNFTKDAGYLKISTPELTAMDLLLYPHKAAGLGNIATVLYELIDHINASKLVKLAQQTNGKGWVQRLGYILEQLDSDNEKSAKHKATVIAKLAKYLSKQKISYLRLTPELPVKGYKRNSKWKIIENTTVESDL